VWEGQYSNPGDDRYTREVHIPSPGLRTPDPGAWIQDPETWIDATFMRQCG
jgi:hypothetical protein